MFSEIDNSKAECARIFWCLCEEIQGKESKENVEVELSNSHLHSTALRYEPKPGLSKNGDENGL